MSMKLGVPVLDGLLGEIELGSTILISTIGELGLEIITTALKRNEEKAVVLVNPTLKKRLKEMERIEKAVYLTLGEDFGPQELFKVTHMVREIPEDRFVGVFFLQPLLIFHPPETVHRLFSELTTIAAERNFIMTAVVDKRLLDERSLALFENSATHVIDIVEVVEGFKITRGIRVKKSPHGVTGFYKLDLSKGEVIVGDALG